ncbi:MAG: DUF6544 family protein [Bacteroidales bacterium]
MKKQFIQEVKNGFKQQTEEPKVIKNEDIAHLPELVKKYLHFVGVVGKENVYNMKVSFSGRLRGAPEAPWMKMKAIQYSFFKHAIRLFYIKAYKAGIPAFGLHIFKNGKASMVVKFLGLFKLVDNKGKEMDIAETVTHFNDMCLMAPSTLVGADIKWKATGNSSVNAGFTNNGITISADLFFNEKGALVNFISNNRYDLSNPSHPELYPFSTPIESYKNFNGFNLPEKAKTIYHKPGGDFCYGEFCLESIFYNVDR